MYIALCLLVVCSPYLTLGHKKTLTANACQGFLENLKGIASPPGKHVLEDLSHMLLVRLPDKGTKRPLHRSCYAPCIHCIAARFKHDAEWQIVYMYVHRAGDCTLVLKTVNRLLKKMVKKFNRKLIRIFL